MNNAAATAGPLIMLVEDHVQLRSILERVLVSLGYRVQAVANGDDALQALRQGASVDLIFSDVRMPGSTDGLALAAWVRQHHPAIRVLLQSGYADTKAAEWPILRKPYTDAELVEALRQALA